jgi:Caspase domain
MVRILCAAMLLSLTLAEALADGRVALVVGVSNYEYAGRLANTLNDANDVTAALKRLGFDVETLLDPNKSVLEAAVRRYGEHSGNADVSLFYYSGHALEAAAHNWLLPASARLANERDLRFEAVDLDAVEEQTEGYAKVSILFFDACRDNPFAHRLSRGRSFTPRGLSRVDVGRGGVLVAFATGPGEVAVDSLGGERNSPFTAALLKYIETPGLEIRSLLTRVTKDVFDETKGTQRPWQNSSLEDDFYFLPAAVSPAASSAQSLGPKVANSPQVPQPARPLPDRGEIVHMIERARASIAVGDILSARIILRRAYERGDAEAALELGGTYDPLILRRLKVTVRGYFADPVEAHDWYVKAAELGSVDAIYRIKALSLQNP